MEYITCIRYPGFLHLFMSNASPVSSSILMLSLPSSSSPSTDTRNFTNVSDHANALLPHIRCSILVRPDSFAVLPSTPHPLASLFSFCHELGIFIEDFLTRLWYLHLTGYGLLQREKTVR